MNWIQDKFGYALRLEVPRRRCPACRAEAGLVRAGCVDAGDADLVWQRRMSLDGGAGDLPFDLAARLLRDCETRIWPPHSHAACPNCGETWIEA